MTPQREPEHCGHYEVCTMNNSVLRGYLPKGKSSHIWCEDTVRLANDGTCPHDTRRSPIHQQSALRTCDNILEELHDILKEFGESEDYRFVEAVADLHSRVLTWKERPDIKGNRRPSAPQQPPNNLPNPAENGADMGTVPKDAPNQPPGDDAVLECREIVFNRVTYGKRPYNGDCGQCFLCDNAGGCIVKTDEEIRAALRQQRGEQR